MKKSILFLTVGILFFSCSSSDPEVIEPEQQKSFSFEGNWLGNWSDSLFPSISVSARVAKGGGNSYTGSFFINQGQGPYSPCCGGENDDGFISFTTDGDNVMDFKYSQNAPDYMGGCPGTYVGEGALNDDKSKLIINFTGDDCDGFHDNGVFIFELDD